MVSMRVAIKTLGCKVNQAESEALMEALVRNGFEMVDFSQESDIYLINSCAVTQEAERKTRQVVRQALCRNPQALVLLTGCAARLFRREGKDPWKGRVVILPVENKEGEVLEYVHGLSVSAISLPPEVFSSRVRRWVKVEDGCDHFCSYCIVPHLRGGVRSEPPLRILERIQRLEAEGVREVVLCGINLGYFGRDVSVTLLELLELLVRETNWVRFRLSSLEPFLLTEGFIERYAALGRRVCPHFHLPLQSGSDRILRRMGRGYSTGSYRALTETLRRVIPDVAITTDVIVGFPGETEEDFWCTVNFCEEVGFARTHVFLFSARPGTLAFQWEKEAGVVHEEKKRREKLLLEVSEKNRYRYHERFLGKAVEVVVESIRAPFAFGYSENYLPVRLPDVLPVEVGTLLRARVQGIGKDFVIARVSEREL
ncbi:MAG: tRNA (N(6)-L-threonylcarbamoyladenosine(37)-C(2))-methylthiotransferase MtaB [Candidatus Caldatribacteriaceae bacterium]